MPPCQCAVLPGIALGFLLSGTRSNAVMFAGAILAGFLTAFFSQWLRRFGRVDAGAAMGVVFTVLFAVGLLLIVRGADSVDLDPSCVLYGALEIAPLDLMPLPSIHAGAGGPAVASWDDPSDHPGGARAPLS